MRGRGGGKGRTVSVVPRANIGLLPLKESAGGGGAVGLRNAGWVSVGGLSEISCRREEERAGVSGAGWQVGRGASLQEEGKGPT